MSPMKQLGLHVFRNKTPHGTVGYLSLKSKVVREISSFETKKISVYDPQVNCKICLRLAGLRELCWCFWLVLCCFA